MVKAKQILHNLFSGLHGFFLFSLVFRLSVFYANTGDTDLAHFLSGKGTT